MTEAKLKEVKNWVKEEMKKGSDPQHGWNHLERVAGNALRIVESLDLKEKIDLNLLQAACYLHDVNQVGSSPGLLNYFSEIKKLKKILPKILFDFYLSKNEKETLKNAIYSCPYSFPLRRLNKKGDLYTRILQDADTLDFFSKKREQSFVKAREKFSFYAFLGLFSDWAFRYGRKNLKKYLNFPQLAEESYVQKSQM